MRRAIVIAAALVSLVPPAAAPAQSGSGRRDEDQAVVLGRFAECVVARWRRSVVQVVEQVPATAQERQRLSGAIGGWGFCLEPLSAAHTSLVFQPDVMRGPFIEALYEKDFTPGRSHIGALAVLPDPIELVRRPGTTDRTRNAAIVGVFATCVVLRRTADAAALLATAPASRDEARAIGGLASDFGNCFPAGAQFDITVPLLRGYLAEALYRQAALAAATEGVRP
jgi:hypothetical protein